MKKKLLSIFAVIILLSSNIYSQTGDTLFTAFYNLENLFDVIDDKGKDDAEFLPDGSKEWTSERLDKKFFNTARVIRSMNNGNGPDILGVCEIEHQNLLDTLIAKFLNDKNYKTAGLESPDNRGIENGLIYNADKFNLIEVTGDTVNLSDGYPTRLVLGTVLVSNNSDTIHVFVNHWPSRRGGESESQPNRIAAAGVLRFRVDSLLALNKNAKIIIMGDFNDEPHNESIMKTLMAQPFICDSIPLGKEETDPALFNLAFQAFQNGEGSYKFRDDWNMLDQIIVSTDLLIGEAIQYECGSFEVYKPDFVLTKSGKYMGTSFPTYGGNRYLGGYSDHFPVTAKFIISGK